LKADSATITYR